VTATHTAGVYLLGAVTLYASRYVVPERLYPWLGVLSGVTIAGLGGYLLLRRYAAGRQEHEPDHSHGHSHHTHAHAHAPAYTHSHTHDHDHHHEVTLHHHAHSHMPPHEDAYHTHSDDHEVYHHHPIPGEMVSFRELLTLGITGGMVPCPAALVVLLSAVAMQRIGFGLLLIVAFSVGLAAVLMAIGLLMVYARQFMARFQGEGRLIRRWLPLTSAAVVTVFGMAMTIQALVTSGILRLRL
jgi:nickel/cobalt exporter